jgi:hypothetical protein
MSARVKYCPVCSHLERSTVEERALSLGQLPQSIRRRYAGLSRRAIQRHRDVCLRVDEEAA